MMRKYILTLIIAILFTSLSLPQDVKKSGGFARISSMGANPYIVDPFFQITNPAWGAEYDHFIMGDIGSSAGNFAPGGVGQFFSLNFGLTNNFTLGVILTRNNFNGLGISTVDPLSNFPALGIIPGGIFGNGGVVSTLNGIVPGGVVPMDNNFEAMGTISFGKTSVGLGISYTGTTNETPFGTTGVNVGSASQFGVNIGLLTNLTNSFKLDLGASLLFPSASFEPGAPNSNTSEVSQTIIGINGRLFWKMSNKVWLVPVVNFATVSGTIENGTTATATSSDMNSVTLLSVGLGINYVVGDFLLAGGPSLSSISLTRPAAVGGNPPELSTSVFSFPVWNIGLEWNLLEWLTGRLGYIAATSKVTNEGVVGGTPTEPQVGEAIVTVFPLPVTRGITLGVGLHFGDFTLDAVVNEDVLRQGFSNIGGGGQAGATFAYLSASYAIPK